MKLNFIRSIGIAAMLLFVAVSVKAQVTLFPDTANPTLDTIKVVMLVSDTSHYYSIYYTAHPCKDRTNLYTLCVEAVKEDKGNCGYGQCFWMYGFEVRQKNCCVNGNNTNLSFYQQVPYYTHLYYLDDKKNKLKSGMIVWMSTPVK